MPKHVTWRLPLYTALNLIYQSHQTEAALRFKIKKKHTNIAFIRPPGSWTSKLYFRLTSTSSRNSAFKLTPKALLPGAFGERREWWGIILCRDLKRYRAIRKPYPGSQKHCTCFLTGGTRKGVETSKHDVTPRRFFFSGFLCVYWSVRVKCLWCSNSQDKNTLTYTANSFYFIY